MAAPLSLLEPQPPVDPQQEAMRFLGDSTLGVVIPAIIGGYAMGCVFSLFGSMVSMETTTMCMGTADYFRYSMSSAHRLGKSFSFFGLVFSGMEVALEKRRGSKDPWNPIITGAALGGFYGHRAYRRPGLVAGIAGGALASAAIEKIMDGVGMAQK